MYTPERQGTAGTSCHNKLHTIWELWYSVLRTFSLLNSAQLTALGPPSARETRESLKLRNMQASSTRYFAMCQPHGRPEPQASLRFPPLLFSPPAPSSYLHLHGLVSHAHRFLGVAWVIFNERQKQALLALCNMRDFTVPVPALPS